MVRTAVPDGVPATPVHTRSNGHRNCQKQASRLDHSKLVEQGRWQGSRVPPPSLPSGSPSTAMNQILSRTAFACRVVVWSCGRLRFDCFDRRSSPLWLLCIEPWRLFPLAISAPTTSFDCMNQSDGSFTVVGLSFNASMLDDGSNARAFTPEPVPSVWIPSAVARRGKLVFSTCRLYQACSPSFRVLAFISLISDAIFICKHTASCLSRVLDVPFPASQRTRQRPMVNDKTDTISAMLRSSASQHSWRSSEEGACLLAKSVQ